MLDWQFSLLLLSNGVLIGLVYALIGLGFVLVDKATDALNFAQGEFVMIAGFVVVAFLLSYKAPLWLSVVCGLAAMIAFGFGLERAVLRKLIGRPVIAVVMATIGLAAVLRGIGPLTWGADTKNLALPISDEPFVLGPLFIPPIQIVGAVVGGLIVGIVENVAAGYVDPYVGGGTKDFAPYVLMILALMIRPYGIFGKRIIERI